MIGAVVTNYNGKDCVLDCIAALRAQSHALGSIVLADDCSTDGSPDLVRAEYPEVRIVSTGENSGPGRARNLAVAALDAECDRVLFVDNDVVLAPDGLEQLDSELGNDESVAFVQARSVRAEDHDLVHYDVADLHYLGLLSMPNFFVAKNRASGEPRDAGAAVSLCFLARRSAFESIGGFREPLFFYFEDVDLSWRVRLAGHRVRWTPRAVCVHGHGTPTLSTRDARLPARRAYYHARNRRLLVWTCLHWRTLLVTWPVQAGYGLTQLFFATAKGQGWAALRGACAAYGLLPTVLRWRRQNQQSRKRRDTELLVATPLSVHPGIADRGLMAFVRRTMDTIFVGWWRILRGLCG